MCKNIRQPRHNSGFQGLQRALRLRAMIPRCLGGGEFNIMMMTRIHDTKKWQQHVVTFHWTGGERFRAYRVADASLLAWWQCFLSNRVTL